MFVSDWMTKEVYTLTPEDYVSDAVKMMKERRIKHIPIVKNDRLTGIISDRDIKECTPSKATTLDVYELHYLLAKTRIKEIMKGNVVTVTPGTPVEEAAMILRDRNIGALPVVEADRLVGIMSDHDIFRVLVDITGVRHGGNRIYLTVKDAPGSIKEVADVIRRHNFHLQSVLTSYENVPEGFRKVVLRTKGAGDTKGLRAELEATYQDVRLQEA